MVVGKVEGGVEMKQTTYKLIDRDNTLLDVNADPIDLDALADLLERMKTVEERESPNSSHSFISSFFTSQHTFLLKCFSPFHCRSFCH